VSQVEEEREEEAVVLKCYFHESFILGILDSVIEEPGVSVKVDSFLLGILDGVEKDPGRILLNFGVAE